MKKMKEFLKKFLFPIYFLSFILAPIILPGVIIYIGFVKQRYDIVKIIALALGAGFFLVLSLGSLHLELSGESPIIKILIFIGSLILLGLFIHFLISHGYYPWWLA